MCGESKFLSHTVLSTAPTILQPQKTDALFIVDLGVKAKEVQQEYISFFVLYYPANIFEVCACCRYKEKIRDVYA